MDDRVTGRLRYSQDAERPGMLVGRILRSLHPHARVTAVRQIEALPPGAVLLLPDDVADCAPYGCIVPDTHVLAQGRVRFVGDPLAAVAAPDERTARRALRCLEVDYEPLPAVTTLDAALAADAAHIHDVGVLRSRPGTWHGLRPVGGNVVHRFGLVSGRGETGFDEADVVVEGTWTCAGAAHAPLEPHAALAEWAAGRLTVWTGTQTPFNVRGELAVAFRIAEVDVRVVSPPMGGSFGAKTFTRIEAIAAALARRAGAPVKVVLPREEVFVTLVRHPARIRVRLGAQRDGRFVARRVWAEWDTGGYADTGPNVAAKGAWAALGPYRCPHIVVESDCVYTNSPPAGAYRGYAATQAAWAGEQCVDLLADALEIDPLELRLKNVLRDGDRFATGEVMHDFHVAECLEQVARRIGWHADRRGKGLCALMKGMQTPSRSEARVVLNDGAFTVESATTDVGQGRDRTLRAIASSRLGVDADAIGTARVDTDRSPFDTRTTSSRSAHMMSGAVGRAADDIRRQLADDLEAAPADLRFTRGGVEVTGSPGTWRPLESLGTIVGRGDWEIAGGLDPDNGHGIASAHWHQGAGAVAVDVDEETGIVQIADLAVAVYAGRVIDASDAALQCEGSVVMGVGSALYEETAYADGQIVTGNFSDYLIPAFRDVPPFTAEVIERPGADVHGLGETALPLIPAAVGNALRSLGVAQDRMPVSPESVLRDLDRSRPQ